MKITELEKASLNSSIHTTRMALCESIQEMVETLKELDAIIALPPTSSMYEPQFILDAKKESKAIMKTLSNIATLVEQQSGISA